jgi:hypothetical protein
MIFRNRTTHFTVRLKEILMQSKYSLSFLRRVLAVDAASSAAMGVGLSLLAPTLAPVLNLPADLLRDAGLILLPFAAFVAFLAASERPSRAGIWMVIALNAIWTIDSIALLLTEWVAPNALGYAFVVLQAIIVGIFAELEYVGLRKDSIVSAN